MYDIKNVCFQMIVEVLFHDNLYRWYLAKYDKLADDDYFTVATGETETYAEASNEAWNAYCKQVEWYKHMQEEWEEEQEEAKNEPSGLYRWCNQ